MYNTENIHNDQVKQQLVQQLLKRANTMLATQHQMIIRTYFQSNSNLKKNTQNNSKLFYQFDKLQQMLCVVFKCVVFKYLKKNLTCFCIGGFLHKIIF